MIGAGRLGPALARLLVEAGEPVAAIASRTPEHARRAAAFAGGGVRAAPLEELPGIAGRVLIVVSDAAIAEVAERLAEAGFAGGAALHCCGSVGPEPLAPLDAAGASCGVLHPLQTVPSPEEGVKTLRGIYWSITGEGEAAAWAGRIVGLLDGHAVTIPASARPLYHAAAVTACNLFIALEDAALAMLERAGVPRREALAALSPIVTLTCRNIFRLGPEAALTGPISRGDRETVARHLEAMRLLPATIQDVFRAGALHTVSLARRKGLDALTAAHLERLLRDNSGRNA